WAWGGAGWFGDGRSTTQPTPLQVGTDTHWASVDARFYLVAVKTDGTLWRWPSGDGSVPRGGPAQVGTDTDWESASTGEFHAVARKTDGTLWAWGYNEDSHLALPDWPQTQSTPGQVGTETHWAAVAGGIGHTVAMKADKTLWAWGANWSGQVGDGTTAS